MSLCILCRSFGESDEHVVPEGIGGRKTIRRVCRACNNWYGHEVDAKLANHPLLAFDLARLGIAGRGSVPDPFKRTTLKDDPEVAVIGVGSEDGMKVQTRVRKTPRADGTVDVHAVGSDWNELLTAVNKTLRRNGRPEMTLDELRSHATVSHEPPWLAVETKASLVDFYPALVKIAYEVAWMAIGDAYLDDRVGEIVRAALNERPIAAEDLPVRLRARVVIAHERPLVPVFRHTPDVHTITLLRVQEKTFASVRIFAAFEALLPIAEAYDGIERVITVDPVSGTWDEKSLEDALGKLAGMNEQQ